MHNITGRIVYRAVKPPCGKECPRRQVGCHGHCEDWDKYQEALKAEKEKAYAASRADSMTTDYQIRSAQNNKKGWKKYK